MNLQKLSELQNGKILCQVKCYSILIFKNFKKIFLKKSLLDQNYKISVILFRIIPLSTKCILGRVSCPAGSCTLSWCCHWEGTLHIMRLGVSRERWGDGTGRRHALGILYMKSLNLWCLFHLGKGNTHICAISALPWPSTNGRLGR